MSRTSIYARRVEPFRRPHARKTPVHFYCSRICDVGGCRILGAKRSRFAAGGSQLAAAASTANYRSAGHTKSPGRIANKSDSITLELTKDQVTAAPEYKEDTPIVVLGASGTLQPLNCNP